MIEREVLMNGSRIGVIAFNGSKAWYEIKDYHGYPFGSIDDCVDAVKARFPKQQRSWITVRKPKK